MLFYNFENMLNYQVNSLKVWVHPIRFDLVLILENYYFTDNEFFIKDFQQKKHYFENTF